MKRVHCIGVAKEFASEITAILESDVLTVLQFTSDVQPFGNTVHCAGIVDVVS